MTFKNTREDFWAQVEKRDDGHWIWMGALLPQGYGYFYFEGGRHYVHRFSYEELVGPIPEGLEIDHLAALCPHRNCVNPDHLEPVTHRENVLRSNNFAGMKARQTHCIRGHEFTPENTGRTRRGSRTCRTCDRDKKRALRAAKETT